MKAKGLRDKGATKTGLPQRHRATDEVQERWAGAF
jgi:hypothetical protein